jgi:NAD(P)-dependent dehydrogenase (short-subunit alcohol dehydrogenase family)
MDRLKGKAALVYGAGPNIGGTIAYFLAREGAEVLVVDVDEAAAKATSTFIGEKGFRCEPWCGDATIESDVIGATDRIVELFGKVDIVVNMAGSIYWASVLNMDLAQWSKAIQSFPTAGMMTTKYAARKMVEKKTPGSIIHILSTAAHFGQPEAAAYATAKAGLLNLARSAAMDLARYGVRVNTVTPSSTEHQLWTVMKDEVTAGRFERQGGKPQYSRDDYLKNLPLGRFPQAADMAWACVFLASEEARSITGADIPVDCGLRHKYPTWRPGDWTGVNIDDYVKGLRRTEYGEDKGPLIASDKGTSQ